MIFNKNNLPTHIIRHSPTGMNWGYGGSGPADLAFSLLVAVIGRDEAEKYYQKFKWDFVAAWTDDWEISDTEIKNWYAIIAKNKLYARRNQKN